MKNITYTCDFCKNVLEESTEKQTIQVRNTLSDSNAAFFLIKEWWHVCPICFHSLSTKIKSLKPLSEEIKNEITIDILQHENLIMRKLIESIANFTVSDESEWCEAAESMYYMAKECLAELSDKKR